MLGAVGVVWFGRWVRVDSVWGWGLLGSVRVGGVGESGCNLFVGCHSSLLAG